MTVAEMKAGARRAVGLIDKAMADIAEADGALTESRTVAKKAIEGSGRGDKDEAVLHLDGAVAETAKAGRAAGGVRKAVWRWHDAV